jgi:hypothetical protein
MRKKQISQIHFVSNIYTINLFPSAIFFVAGRLMS